MSRTSRAHSPAGVAAFIATVCTLLVFAFAAVACGGDGNDGSDDHTAPAGTSTLVPRDGEWQRLEGLRGTRYCEVLLLRVIDARLQAEVWNTITRSDCPQEQWDALDMEAIKSERGAVAALRNGPRYWLTDAIERRIDGAPPEVTMFGQLEMGLGATVDLGPLPPDLSSYKERIVARQTVFEYSTGARIHELRRPDGTTYVMQSYSVQVDPSLNEAGLEYLSQRLELPEGWSYSNRTIYEPLRVGTSAAGATVIQDSFSNTYQRLERP
jgi:hypothetical protein